MQSSIYDELANKAITNFYLPSSEHNFKTPPGFNIFNKYKKVEWGVFRYNGTF